MTAPLKQNYRLQYTRSLRAMVYALLDAIDLNHITKVELLLCEILRENIPEVSLQLFYNYAKKKKASKVCDYIKTVLYTTYNH